mgnify:CR=1 FL=1
MTEDYDIELNKKINLGAGRFIDPFSNEDTYSFYIDLEEKGKVVGVEYAPDKNKFDADKGSKKILKYKKLILENNTFSKDLKDGLAKLLDKLEKS